MTDTLEEAYRRIAELERSLAGRNAALEAAVKELDGFSYSVSHDLRSPLRAIGGFTQMLQEDCGASLNEDCRRYLGVILASTRKLEQQIEGLLEYSRIGRQPLQRGEVDMAALARRALDAVSSKREVPLPEVVMGDLPAASGDPDLLYHVWHNLLANAMTFTGRTTAPRIEVGGDREVAESTWYVRDNGAGFDMRYAGKLFGMFQRLHAEDEFPGIGVGLAVARRVVTRHGGRVWAEARPAEGACFQFSLPHQPVD